MTGFMIGGMIFVICIVVVIWVASPWRIKETITPEILPDYPDDTLLGLGKGFGREIINIADESITYVDAVTGNNIVISEPILQFVREVKMRKNTFILTYGGDDYCDTFTYIRSPYEYTIKDTLTSKTFKFSVKNSYGTKGSHTTAYNSLDMAEDWITKDEKRYLYSVLFDEFYIPRAYKLKELQNKRIRNNMKSIYRKEEK